MSDSGLSTSRARWKLADGVQLLGPVEGSGLREPSYLLERSDGQVLHVSLLVHELLSRVDTEAATSECIAIAVTEATGRTLTAQGVDHLAQTRLEPLGLLVGDGPSATQPRLPVAPMNPLLGLRLRITLIPAPAVRRLGTLLGPLYRLPVVVATVLATLAIDATLALRGDAGNALNQVLATPVFLLALMAVLIASALIHEVGHAAACSFGGAAPGRIGAGVYLVFPAFYSDVTASYRLSRAGRIRTDLGGLYFNLWCVIALGTGYLISGAPVLLLAVILLHLEMAQQLVPTVRFDGYYVLADLAGVPDLFARVRPILRSLRPGAAPDPRVSELRPAARRIITAWVVVVVPTLMFAAVWTLLALPTIVGRTVQAIEAQVGLFATALQPLAPARAILATISIVLLTLPLAGLLLLLIATSRSLTIGASAALRRVAGRPSATSLTSSSASTARETRDGRPVPPP